MNTTSINGVSDSLDERRRRWIAIIARCSQAMSACGGLSYWIPGRARYDGRRYDGRWYS
ncbi:MAG TPA: hypothetical protein QF901_05780 [Gammaproteobacteria bacterium]|nr:hypothetical protein [Gammaproteobacteria bacterium]